MTAPTSRYLVMSHLAGESDDMTKLGEAVEENATMNYTLTLREGGGGQRTTGNTRWVTRSP